MMLNFSTLYKEISLNNEAAESKKLTEDGTLMEFKAYTLYSFSSIFTSIFVLSQCYPQADVLATCLSDHNVNNFSLYPSSDNDPSPYFKLLGFSIQNLRFMDPSVPKPVAIIMPEGQEQLVHSVLCCRKGSLEIRVRCGGHSYEGTSYIANDGALFVLIDMMNLDRVSIDLEAQVAWVEGGATLGKTYSCIAESSPVHGFSAGSCPTVGISGHIAGGGFGLLSRKYGLAADNVVDALLIDANGRLLDRAAMGEDVFWAIRGGGGGIWGIVYAWKIQLLNVPNIVTGFIVSRPGSRQHVAELVHQWQHVASRLDDDFYLSVFVGAGLPGTKTPGISATFKGFYLGPKTEALSIINGVFPELVIQEGDCKEMSWIESILYFSGLENGSSISDLKNRFLQSKNYFKAKSDYVRTPLSINSLISAIDILEKEPKGYVILDPYGGAMQRISSDSIAFPHRRGNIFSIQYLVEWEKEDNAKGKEYMEWMRGFYNSMASVVSSGPRAAYINYMDFDLGVMDLLNSTTPSADAVERARVWGEKYFLRNYDRLVRVKTLIDPMNIFRNQQGIPPMSTATWKAEM